MSKKHNAIIFRTTNEEKARYLQMAKDMGLPLSKYLRSLFLKAEKGFLMTDDQLEAFEQKSNEFIEVGYSLNKMARKLDKRYEEDNELINGDEIIKLKKDLDIVMKQVANIRKELNAFCKNNKIT